MTTKQNPTVIRKNSKTYKLSAPPELMNQLAALSMAHTLEMFYVPATAQGMPSIDTITQSLIPLKTLLAEIASSKSVAGREVKPQHINGVSFKALVSAGYFVIEFSETICDDVKNTIHRYGYRLRVTDESGLTLASKLTAAKSRDIVAVMRDLDRI